MCFVCGDFVIGWLVREDLVDYKRNMFLNLKFYFEFICELLYWFIAYFI